MKLSKQNIEDAIAFGVLLFWMIIVIPILVQPLDMTLFEKGVVSTCGAMGGFALFVTWKLLTVFK